MRRHAATLRHATAPAAMEMPMLHLLMREGLYFRRFKEYAKSGETPEIMANALWVSKVARREEWPL